MRLSLEKLYQWQGMNDIVEIKRNTEISSISFGDIHKILWNGRGFLLSCINYSFCRAAVAKIGQITAGIKVHARKIG